MNECKIELLVNQKGHFGYRVTITKYDIIDTTYANEGTLLTFEEAKEQELAFKKLRPGFSFQIKREKVYDYVDHKNIRNFIYDKTGSVNQEKLNILYKLYTKGKQNPTIKFNFQ